MALLFFEVYHRNDSYARNAENQGVTKVFLAISYDVYYTIQAQRRCDEMVDVADSKCVSPFSLTPEKVVAVQSLFVYNKICKFNIPPAHPS